MSSMHFNKLTIHTEGLETGREMFTAKHFIEIATIKFMTLSILIAVIIHMVNSKAWQSIFATLHTSQFTITIMGQNIHLNFMVVCYVYFLPVLVIIAIPFSSLFCFVGFWISVIRPQLLSLLFARLRAVYFGFTLSLKRQITDWTNFVNHIFSIAYGGQVSQVPLLTISALIRR